MPVQPDTGQITAVQLGRNICLFRRRRGISQKDLAARVNICVPPMNNIEKGRNFPSSPVIFRIAKVLGVAIEDLFAVDTSQYVNRLAEARAPYAVRSEEQAEYIVSCRDQAWHPRRMLTLRAYVVRLGPTEEPLGAPAEETIGEVADAFLALEDFCAAQKKARIPLRLSPPATENGLERMAGRVRGFLDVGEAVIFDYLELLENAGLRVVFMRLPGDMESLACHDKTSDNVFLLVRSGMNVERQLFRLAYELGRVYLYLSGFKSLVSGGAKSVDGRLDAEHSARRFAAFFLMPAEAVHATVHQLGIGVKGWTWDLLLRIKHRFGVSAESFLYRLGELDLIAGASAESFKARIAEHYKATNFGEPDGSRRILTPNGRLGDLLLLAASMDEHSSEVKSIQKLFKHHGIEV